DRSLEFEACFAGHPRGPIQPSHIQTITERDSRIVPFPPTDNMACAGRLCSGSFKLRMDGNAFSRTESSSIKASSEPEFVERLRCEVRQGFGIVPFVGSGLSAPSGILMGQEFANYLAWTVYVCIVGEHGPETRWDLQRQGWPQM